MVKKQVWLTAVGISVVTAVIFFVGGLRTAGAKPQVIFRDPLSQISAEGAPGSSGPARSVNMRSLPLATAGDMGAYRVKPRPRNGLTDSQWAAAKANAARGAGTALPVTMEGSPKLPGAAGGALTPAATLSFDGDTEFEFCSNLTPADQALAVGDGSNPILQAVNACLSVWNPATGTRLSGPVALTTFFNLPAGTFVSDPRALFDWYNHRFIVTILDTDGGATNNYDIAVSQGDDPTAGWWVYRIPAQSATNAVTDYPRLGQDRTSFYPGFTANPGAIYLASNLFQNSNNAYLHEEWLILPKGPMYAGAGFNFFTLFNMSVGGVFTDTSQPVNVMSPYEQPRAEFFVTSKNINNGSCAAGCNGLTVWAVSNPFSGFMAGGNTPEISGVAVPTTNNYSLAPSGPQSGGPNNIETIDTRISGSATYANGHIHAALNGANGTGGTASIIYKVQPFLNGTNSARCTGAPSVGLCPQITSALIRNETVLNYGTTTAAFFPTPQPDLEGNVTTVFNFATTGSFPGLVYISQRVTQTPGSFVDTGIFLANGQAQYTQGRWGDYTATSPVGVFYAAGNGGFTGNNGMLFSGMYAGPANTWRTRIGFNRFSSPGQQ